jgi:hypothetical protein
MWLFPPRDKLVMDNAAIHCHGENDGLEEILRDSYGIEPIYLPTRSPVSIERILSGISLLWDFVPGIFCFHGLQMMLL